MSSQQTEEWDNMSEAQRNEIKARLESVVVDAERAELRGRLARASRSHYPQASDRS